MKKKKIIALVGILVVLMAVAALILVPRVRLYNAVKDIDLGPVGEMFTQYDVTDDSLVRIEEEYCYISVPEDYKYEENDLIKSYKHSEDEAVSIPVDTNEETFVFLDDSYGETFELFDIEMQMKDLEKGFEDLGYGIPDNEYNTLKNMYLLNEDDYSFWNYNKGLAYALTARMKSETMWMSKQYIYEREDVYATVLARLWEDGKCYYHATVYNPEDLNKSFVIIIRTYDEQTAMAILNSIELK